MSFNLMVFLIVTVVLVTKMVTHIVKVNSPPSNGDGTRLNHLEKTLVLVERRLKNLETIVTGKDYDLKNQFEEMERNN